MAEPFEVSAMHVAGMARALGELGIAADVLARVSPATRAMLERPYDARWHPGSVLVEVSNAVLAQRGSDALEAMTYQMTKQSFGPVLRPVVSVALALTGNDPASVFSRLGNSLQVAMRGVDARWEAISPTKGTLTITYPVPVPVDAVQSWRGVARFLFELSRHADGRMTEHARVNGDRSLRMTLEW